MHAEVNLKVDSRRQDDKNKSLNKLHTSGWKDELVQPL
jgi:hypothetical protein